MIWEPLVALLLLFPVLFPAIELVLNMWTMEQHVASALILLQCAASPVVIVAHSMLLVINEYENGLQGHSHNCGAMIVFVMLLLRCESGDIIFDPSRGNIFCTESGC